MIEHNLYFNGAVQSLGAKNVAGIQFTVGIIEPGEYDFGLAKHTEIIRVFSGELEINGESVTFEPITIHPGERIVIKARSTAVYMCLYG